MCSALTWNSLISSQGAPESPKPIVYADRSRDHRHAIKHGACGEDAAHAPSQGADLVLLGREDTLVSFAAHTKAA